MGAPQVNTHLDGWPLFPGVQTRRSEPISVPRRCWFDGQVYESQHHSQLLRTHCLMNSQSLSPGPFIILLAAEIRSFRCKGLLFKNTPFVLLCESVLAQLSVCMQVGCAW